MSETPTDPRFFLGVMSPYSWFAAERIDQLLPQARWRVVLAGVVFAAHGRESWGFTDEREAKLVDCEKRALERGLGAIVWPAQWPTLDLKMARAIAYATPLGLHKTLALNSMRLAFKEGADLEQLEVVLEAGRRSGIEPGELEPALGDPEIKAALRASTDEALAAGVFGVPTVAVGSELFWGDDRLEDAARAFASGAGSGHAP